MTFVGGDSDDYILFYFNIKELFTVLRQRCSNPIQNDRAFQQKNLYAPEVVFTRPNDFLEGWPPIPWEEDSPQYKNTF
jgi:hypothetical protein